MEPALDSLGLANFAGRPLEEVIGALTNAIAPEGAGPEEAAARLAISQTVARLYEEWGVSDGGLERLESLSEDDLRFAIVESVSTYIFVRWAFELGQAIERSGLAPAEVCDVGLEMEQFIRDSVGLDLREVEPLEVDWNGSEGEALIERIYAEAYSFIETIV